MKERSNTQAMAAMAIAFGLAACSKDAEQASDTLVNAPHANTALTMSMAYTRAGAAFDKTVPFHDAANRLVRIDGLKFFISQPFFLDDNDSTVAVFPNGYLLIDLDEGGLLRTIGEVDAHLHTMHFGLGVDTTVNHDDLATLTTPLNDASMWWNTTTGHKFLSLAGQYDSNNDGTVDQPFMYFCGTDALFTPKVIQIHTDADLGGNVSIPLALNIDTLMAGMDVAATPNVEVVNSITTGLMHRLGNSLTHVE